MYAHLVLYFGITPSYVMDEMSMTEVSALMDHAYLKNMAAWEQCRTLTYVTAQVNSRKRLRPTDLLKFEWDDMENRKIRKQIRRKAKDTSEADAKMLQDRANRMANVIKLPSLPQ